MKTFRQFVADQVARGESLPPSHGYIYTEHAQIEICDFLEARSGERQDAEKQSSLQWLQESPGAKKVKALMDELMEGDVAPTILSVRATWERLHGASKPINRNCSECGGTGWAIVRAGDAEGVRRCGRGCIVPPDRLEAPVSQGSVDAEANTALAEAFGRDLAEKLRKPIVVTEPPKLENPITESDFKDLERFTA